MHYVQATVVIPTFNGCQLLAEALEGLGRQTVEHEVIVVDNASTDGTIELLAERFPRTRLVRLPENAERRFGMLAEVAGVGCDHSKAIAARR